MDNKICLKFDVIIKPPEDGINDRLVYTFTSDDGSVVKQQEYSYDSRGIYRYDSTDDNKYFGSFMVDKNKPVIDNIKEIKSLVYALHYKACKVATEYDLYSDSAKYDVKTGGLSDPDVFDKYIKIIFNYITSTWIDEYIKDSHKGG